MAEFVVGANLPWLDHGHRATDRRASAEAPLAWSTRASADLRRA